MTRQSPSEADHRPSQGARSWMTVRVRFVTPLPQADGDHGDPAPLFRPHVTVDESGYGHGV